MKASVTRYSPVPGWIGSHIVLTSSSSPAPVTEPKTAHPWGRKEGLWPEAD